MLHNTPREPPNLTLHYHTIYLLSPPPHPNTFRMMGYVSKNQLVNSLNVNRLTFDNITFFSVVNIRVMITIWSGFPPTSSCSNRPNLDSHVAYICIIQFTTLRKLAA